MKSCGTCKHFKQRGRDQILGDCNAWSRKEWIALINRLPASFSTVKFGMRPEQGSWCAFYVEKKGKK
jgi:hypothetical protein